MIGLAARLAPVRAWELTQGGDAVVVDLGTPGEFSGEHPPGAISLPFSDKGLSERLSSVLAAGTDIILLAESAEHAESATDQLAGSPFPLLGVIVGGRGGWNSAGLPQERLAQVAVDELADLASSRELVILDVREPLEWETGHVPGALLISLGSLRRRIQEVPRQVLIAVICEAGIRSSTGASMLQAEGFPDVANVPEGNGGYRRAGLPLQFAGDAS